MIRHILKDGTVLKDIRGHKVKRTECTQAYDLMQQIRKRGRSGEDIGHNHRD